MEYLSVDFETRSTVDLRKTGVYPYAEHADTSVICMAYAFGDGPVKVWRAGETFPTDVLGWVWAEKPLRAHHTQFERVVWRDCLLRQVTAEVRAGTTPPGRLIIAPKIEQWHDTAAEAAAMALPRSLYKLSRVLNVDEKKDDGGHRLMLQMCKPRSVDEDGTIHWWDEESPEKRARLIDYCKQDVRAERACAKRLRRLTPTERKVYLLDQRINDRGVLLDVPLVEAAQEAVEQGTEEANQELRELTDGEVDRVTKVADLTGWLQDNGAEIENIRKATLRDQLDGEDLPADVERAMAIRLEAGKSSTAKLTAMQRARCSDDRVRGLLLYHGASTGRWSGKLVQPQNFPRGSVKDAERFIPQILAKEFDRIDEPVLKVVASLLRGCFRASPGHRILAGDFGQIEARGLGWLAGEPYGDMEYERMASAIFGVPLEEVTKDQRQVGKVAVLGAGFQMGSDRYRGTVKEWTGLEISEAVAERAIDTFRARKPGVQQFWYDIEDAAIRAAQQPGSVQEVGVGGTVRFTYRGEFLWCVLPSGRPLAYALPRAEMKPTPWGEQKLALTYMGINGYSRKWQRRQTYGGHLTENVVQAVARDLLAEAMLRLEEADYRPVLTVHDEVVSDTPLGHGSVEEYLEIMRQTPAWAAGCPVEADGFEGERYRK